ncbi:hypothetical protein BAC2_03658 [uncultured bacterium]|nr:hypothetical protein BAC2_03658 [uncultured bacterium]
MKKPMTLAEQVRDAQKAVSSWSNQKRESVRLEGSGINQNRGKDRMSYTETLQKSKKS